MTLTSFARPPRATLALSFVTALLGVLLVGCGGGGGDNSPTAEPLTTTLTGVAATGAAIANADVKAVNANGASVVAKTAADGGFSIKIGDAAPFVLSVTDASGKAWYSYAKQAGVTNVNPLTTLAMLDANGNKPLADLAAAWANAGARPTETQVLAAAAKVNANLQSVMLAKGVDAKSVNIFNAAFKADHTGLDAVLDALRVNIVCTATNCTQTINGPSVPGGPSGTTLLTWNGNVATTGFAIGWTGSGGSGAVTAGLGTCKAPVVGTYSLVVQVSVSGPGAVAIPEICVDGLPGKPATQSEFCASSTVTQQLPPGVAVVSCTFAGDSGTIAARIPAPAALDYSIKYSFVKR